VLLQVRTLLRDQMIWQFASRFYLFGLFLRRIGSGAVFRPDGYQPSIGLAM